LLAGSVVDGDGSGDDFVNDILDLMGLSDVGEYCDLLDTPKELAKHLRKKAIEAGILEAP